MRLLVAVTLMAVTFFVGASPADAEDPPIVNTVTINAGQTRTITVSAPSDKVQCQTDYQEDKGSYCLQTKSGGLARNFDANSGARYYACNSPYSLAPTTNGAGDTITYAHTDADGWIGMGGLRQRNDLIEIRGRQLRLTGVGDPGTDYVPLTLYGTQRVRFTNEGYGSPDTYTWETQTCALQVRVRVNVRGPATSTSVNESVTQARTNVRELTTTGRTAGDYIPPSTSRCRVVETTYTVYSNINPPNVQRGEMSWCGIYRDENNREVAPTGQLLSDLCAEEGTTCHLR